MAEKHQAIVLRPQFTLDFITENNEYHIEYELQGSDTIRENSLEEGVITLTTKNSMEDDSAVFSFVLAGNTYWDKILSANDLVVLRIKPGNPTDGNYNTTLLVGLISDVRLEGDYGANSKMYRITGQSLAKALMQYYVGTIRDISVGLAEIGWLQDDVNAEGGLPFTGRGASEVMNSILDRFVKYMRYNFNRSGVKTGIANYLVWDTPTRPWDSWEDEYLLDPSQFVNFDGSVKQMLDTATGKPFNEFFTESTPEGKCELVMRRTPFNPEDWAKLTRHRITSRDVIKESVGKSDMEAYAVYYVVMATALGNLDSIGLGAFPRYHQALVDKYGYKRLEVESIYLAGFTAEQVQNQLGGTDSESGDTGGGGIATGSDYAEKTWNYLRSAGFSEQASAGILASAEAESGVDPTVHQIGGPAVGMFQWEGERGGVPYGRYAGLVNYAKSKGKSWSDIQVQLDWLVHEMQGGDPTTAFLLKKHCGGLEAFKQLTDIGRATDIFMWSFERPADQTPGRRTHLAMAWYNKFKGTGNKKSTTKKKKKKSEYGDLTNMVLVNEGDIMHLPEFQSIYNVVSKYTPTELRLNKRAVGQELLDNTVISPTELPAFIDAMGGFLNLTVERIAKSAKKVANPKPKKKTAKKSKGKSPKPPKYKNDIIKPGTKPTYELVNQVGKEYKRKHDKINSGSPEETAKTKNQMCFEFVGALQHKFKGMTREKATEIMRHYIDDGKLGKARYKEIMEDKYGAGVGSGGGRIEGGSEGTESGGDPSKMKKYTEMLYNWYCENPNFYSGEITVVGHPSYRLGEILEIEDLQNDDIWEYYIESVQHEYSYGEGYKTTLGVTRGLADAGILRFRNLWGKSQEFHGGLMGEPSIEELYELSKQSQDSGGGVTGDCEPCYLPMQYLRVSQPENGSWSHRGVYAVDFVGPTANYPYYAPCNCTCIAQSPPSQSAYMIYKSDGKVMCADGNQRYITFAVMHDNNPPHKVGSKVKQGQLLGHTGVSGNVTGDHMHLEVIEGSEFNNFELKNQPNHWGLKGKNLHVYDVFGINNVKTTVDGGGMPWKKTTCPESTGGGGSGANGSKIAMKALQVGLSHEKGKTSYNSYYVFGGGRTSNMFASNPITGDCSSFVYECFNQAGFPFQCGRAGASTWTIDSDTRLKTVFSKGQKSKGMFDKMKKGDIIWFGSGDAHIGIYAGGKKFIGMQGTPNIDYNGGIKVEDLTSEYWWNYFNGKVKRV